MPTEEQIKNHFETIYEESKKEWGDNYSSSAAYFSEFLKMKNITELHLVAAGYGRNISPFLNNFCVIASDYTTNGVKQLGMIQGVEAIKYDVMQKPNKKYSAIYSYSLLHMFEDENKRSNIVNNLSSMLKENGYMMLVNMSSDIKFTSTRGINYISKEEITNYCEIYELKLIEHKKFNDKLDIKNLDGDFIVEAYILQKIK